IFLPYVDRAPSLQLGRDNRVVDIEFAPCRGSNSTFLAVSRLYGSARRSAKAGAIGSGDAHQKIVALPENPTKVSAKRSAKQILTCQHISYNQAQSNEPKSAK